MVKCCVAYNCYNRFDKGQKKTGLTFHKFPLGNKKLLKAWLKNIRRKNFVPSKFSCICSDHFERHCFFANYVNSTRLKETAVPTIFNFSGIQKRKQKSLVGDFEISESKEFVLDGINIDSSIPEEHTVEEIGEEQTKEEAINKQPDPRMSNADEEDDDVEVIREITDMQRKEETTSHQKGSHFIVSAVMRPNNILNVIHTKEYAKDQRIVCDAQTQTEITLWELRLLQDTYLQAKSKICDLKKRVDVFVMNEQTLHEDVTKAKYYTGLPGVSTLTAIAKLINPTVCLPKSVTQYQLVLMTLMKLRLNLPIRDLGYRFLLTQSTTTKLYASCIDELYYKLSSLIQVPERDGLLRNISSCCLERIANPQNICLVFESFTVEVYHADGVHDKYDPGKVETQSYLLGILPQGIVAFLFKDESQGRLNHEHLYSGGVLEQLQEGDVIVAGNGFDTDENVNVNAVEVVLSENGEKQLSAIEDAKSYKHFRIHTLKVESSIKSKYSILSSPMIVEKGFEKNYSYPDKIVQLCCALINLSNMPVAMNV